MRKDYKSPTFLYFIKNILNKTLAKRAIAIAAISLLFSAFILPWSYGKEVNEKTSYGSLLVWRTEAQALKYGEGDYVLPELDPGNTYELSEKVETAGTITSMALAWEFTGEVTMEASADGGSNYTSVVNATPLKTGFTAGNSFKWRVTLGQDSKLYDIRVCLKDDAGAAGPFGNPDISEFKYKKAVALSNPSQKELFNYQVRLKIASETKAKTAGADVYCEGSVEKDFRDIRFTAADEETSLPYYIENKEAKSADVWVKVPQIPLEGTVIYIYYGNEAASSLSDAEKVFDFYDDFSAEALDEAKWEVDTGLEGSYEIADSKLKLNSAGILSKSYELKDGIIEYKAEPVSGYEVRFTARTDKEGLSQTTYSSPYSGAEHCIAVSDIVQANEQEAVSEGKEYDYKIIADGENLTFERYYSGEKEASVSYKDEGGLVKGYIGLKAGIDNLTYYDWVRVRKYAKNEPAVTEAGQEAVKPAVFVNTTVSSNGNVILEPAGEILAAAGKKYKAQGSYSFSLDPERCDINKIIPLMEGELSGLTLDISADEGKTWLYECENSQAYKAPLDFAKTEKFLIKVNFSSSAGLTTPELSKLALEYALGPVVRSENIKCSGASGEAGIYVSGDTIVVEWDNSKKGDNNSDISSVACNFEAFGGAKETEMLDEGKGSDKKAGDSIYTAAYKISPESTIKTTGNIFVTAANSCGETTTDGHILSLNAAAEAEAEEEAEEAAEEELDLEKLMEAGQRPGTSLYDLLIKVDDNYLPDSPVDSEVSYKAGDIILVKPSGHNWSATERKSFLIIKAYLTPEEAKELTKPKQIATGEVDSKGMPVMKVVRQRAKKIDLQKLGFADKGLEKIDTIRKSIEKKALSIEKLVEEK